MGKVAVIGAGSWGTALALVLADNNHEIKMWSYRQTQVDEINQQHTNSKYLPSVELPKNIQAYNQIQETVQECEYILLVVPTKAIREVCQQLKPYLKDNQIIIHASKGIEPETHKRVSEMIEDELGNDLQNQIVVLSGPSHAEEVAKRQPTTVTASSRNKQNAEKTQDLFINENFRVYTNDDIVGVEIGGAIKNIIALGAGISDGLGYGDNAKAALITRGLAEITRLGVQLNANPLTFAGLTGVGDLIVTCTSTHSRNWRAGNMLGKGYKLDDILEQMGMVVEGVRTTKAVYQLSKKLNIDMPITSGIYDLLFNNKEPKQVVDQLMQRDRTNEISDLSNILLKN
ncbi:NAD(P)H-dependent glycerol-3-phosphate dehydrogenase [Bacillaceae bacterium W0354]